MTELGAHARRVGRLRLELDDEGIWLPDDDDLCEMLLVELDYARHPHAHEGVAPRYGALLSSGIPATNTVGPLTLVDVGDVSLNVVRRLADGRSSFVVRTVGARDRLVCFDRTREYESSAVHLALGTGALVLQRLGRGWVRLSTPDGIATWDGMHWATKALSIRIAERVAPTLVGADPTVLANLLEFCTHWLAAGRVGATLVWSLDGDPAALGHLGMAPAVAIPQLDLTSRTHFAPLLNALAQYDRAALVDPSGHISTVGVHLRSSEASRRDLAPFRGTRHTAALRFSAEEHAAAVFVVSSSGALSVFWHGRRLDTD
ncbi:MAG: diadenylate cyclase [Ilumatobacteraceae bacterium]